MHNFSFLFRMKGIEMYHHIQIIGNVVISFHSKNKRLNIKGLGPQSTTFLSNCSLSLIKSYEENVPGNFQRFIINIGTVHHGVLSQGSNYSDTGSGMWQWSTVKRSFQHHSQTCYLKDPGRSACTHCTHCTHAHRYLLSSSWRLCCRGSPLLSKILSTPYRIKVYIRLKQHQ